MAFRFDPESSARREVRRVVAERLGAAIALLEALDGASPEARAGDDAPDVVTVVHDVRKRCKEARGLAQLVRPRLGRDFAIFNGLVRDAAAELAGFRDAHAGLATFEHLLAGVPGPPDDVLLRVRDVLARAADEATRAARASDPRLERAGVRLVEARELAVRWKVPKGFAAVDAGLRDTYGRGRKRRRDVVDASTDEALHEWRKAVKQLWYQARLLEPAAPSAMAPLVDRLDDLSEALGDDHDLAVLVERLTADPEAFGGVASVEHATSLARRQQAELRERAVRLGASVYAERPGAFVERVGAYWALTARLGPERATGGIVALHADQSADGTAEDAADASHGATDVEGGAGEGGAEHVADVPDGAADADTAAGEAADAVDAPDGAANAEGGAGDAAAGDAPAAEAPPAAGGVERERKFLVDAHPEPDGPGTTLRQGYLAIEHPVSVRIRDAGDEGCTLTVKAGSGSTRVELEWPIQPDTFETLWRHTGDRRIAKTRYRLPHGDHTIELDVFHEALDGLTVAEVEFTGDEAMGAYVPPDWFGREVTDDHRYTNAWLAEHGLDGLETGDATPGGEPAGPT
jgi:CYTH domain-containing protein/CHAD domain-containing protein